MAGKIRVQYGTADETLRSDDALTRPLRYTVESTGSLGDQQTPHHHASVIDPLITAFARRPDVTGGLAEQRAALVANRTDGLPGRSPMVTPLDGPIADRIEAYLRKNYAYTLDLTAVDRVRGRDPMVAFLYDFKRGHCEYFRRRHDPALPEPRHAGPAGRRVQVRRLQQLRPLLHDPPEPGPRLVRGPHGPRVGPLRPDRRHRLRRPPPRAPGSGPRTCSTSWSTPGSGP